MVQKHIQTSCFVLRSWSFYFHALKTVLGKGTSMASCCKKKQNPRFNNLLWDLMRLLLVVVERVPGLCERLRYD